MLGEIVLAGARPGASKIMSVVVLTIGIGVFMLFKPSKKAGSGDTFEWNADMAVGCGLVFMKSAILDRLHKLKSCENSIGERIAKLNDPSSKDTKTTVLGWLDMHDSCLKV